ncbi:hypothetical protein FEM48_Zijuj10G0023600 [Ziziphus jujuba var. spinosa]|uniref:Uncharacterized protein n=1 Tax=Ziziphus jujuba var. spinosa TaxID=714518 RepID=A0A978UKQ9_ZIZJJ|nr:hypothetical protein FEM48_Zijuj10G0023600 [Ziziphus jujuba var. spinosa]
MANAKSILSTAASLAASAMLILSIVRDFLPHQLHSFLFSSVQSLSQCFSSQLIAIVEEFQGYSMNQVFETAEIHLCSKTNSSNSNGDCWCFEEVHLNHPMNFKTLALDSELKKELLEELDNFMNEKEYYQRSGKAWKRGYLLYGPPGTGKTSLIAAMSNHLKFDIYNLDLTDIQNDSHLRFFLLRMSSRAIIVVEDID